MNNQLIAAVSLTVAMVALPGDNPPASPTTPLAHEVRMNAKATGSFDVKMSPQPASETTGGAIGRFVLDKQFHGDLEAGSVGEMLAAMTAVKGSAGYVAIEKVTGKLGGHSGTFCLQHNGLMTRGEGSTNVVVIPDSGTGEFTGLTGTMAIKITKEGHFYEFDYSLPAAR